MAKPGEIAVAKALANGYIRNKYDRLSGGEGTSMPALSEKAMKQLAGEMKLAESSLALFGRTRMTHFTYRLEDLDVTETGKTWAFTCVEVYTLTFDAQDPASRTTSGMRLHTFAAEHEGGHPTIIGHANRDVTAIEREHIRERRAKVDARNAEEAGMEPAGRHETMDFTVAGSRSVARLPLLVAMVALLLTSAVLLAYLKGPRTVREEVSLQTAQSRLTTTVFGFKVRTEVVDTELSKWARANIQVPASEWTWVPSETRHLGWFGTSAAVESANALPYFARQNLEALEQLQASSPRRFERESAKYLELVRGVTIADFEGQDTESFATLPTPKQPAYVRFASTLMATNKVN